MQWRVLLTNADGQRTYGAPRRHADDAITAFFEKYPLVCTKTTKAQIQKWWSEVSAPSRGDKSQTKKQAQPPKDCGLAGTAAQQHTLLLTMLHNGQFSGKHSPSLLKAADIWAMLQAYLALGQCRNCGHLFIILHQVFVPQGVERAVLELIEVAQSGKNLARYAVVRQALQKAHRWFQDPVSLERQMYDDEAALLLTGQYKSWCGFKALFGAHGLMQEWGKSWSQMKQAGSVLEALRDNPDDADTFKSAQDHLKVISGIGEEYLGPHCLRTWLEIVCSDPKGPSVWGGLACAGTNPASSQSAPCRGSPVGWEMWGEMSETVRRSRSFTGQLEPEVLAKVIGAPELLPRQLALLHCEAMGLRDWWTNNSKGKGTVGQSLQSLLSFLECRSGCTLRNAVMEESVLASKASEHGLVYHSARSLVKACFGKWGSWHGVPSRPSISPQATFAISSVFMIVTPCVIWL